MRRPLAAVSKSRCVAWFRGSQARTSTTDGLDTKDHYFWAARGVISVGLSVFGFNAGAQSLYEQMGFEVSAIQVTKTL
ncbi:MAG TPA: hypothetical protein VFC57_05325 [Aeromicrobium sp.]|nr:hypothetical protein [Aeromicrobium sp.]